ncbi:ABC transporter ATP-binding protein [Embleya sp. NPDC020886]|uniref:ABC transporter ATP-binding protein n=1 Tax=Embleya sp. NPDC020886 TaxID=3363980 RepID=UPI0037B11F4D
MAGGAPGAKESRIFGFGPWATARYAKHADADAAVLGRLMQAATPNHIRVFLLSALGAGVPFVVLTLDAADGELTASRLAVSLGAVVGLAHMGVMGYEAIFIAAAVHQLAALRTTDGLRGPRRDRRRPSTASAPVEREPARAASPQPGATIAFDDVWFRYPGTEHDVLCGLDLTVRAGEHIAVVGENGAGTSTMIKLLCGLFVPTRGRILLDGVDISGVDPEEWRAHIAVVFQDFLKLGLSARDNVRLSAFHGPHVGPEQQADVESAAAVVGLTDVVAKLPAGWDTPLSPAFRGGIDLSGGQWQRVALARALHAARTGARVVLLDEPTSALDVMTEAALFDRTMAGLADVTSIVVSHRLSTVRRADRIVVIADGVVAEDDTHDALIASGGRYATLYDLQAQRFRADGRIPDTTGDLAGKGE